MIFTVAGRIDLDSRIEITEGNLTIAGQTAPGGGIELANGSNTSSLFSVRADNVIIRNLRFRPGPTGGKIDAFGITNAKNIIVDYCSFSWSVDEVFDMYIETGSMRGTPSITGNRLPHLWQ